MSARDLSGATLTDAVRASFGGTADDRLRELMESLVRHLHAFAEDVALAEDEWSSAIAFLTETGQISDDRRQEFVLLSDVLGLSMLVIGINHAAPPGATASTVFGPFFVQDAPQVANGTDIANGAPGEPCLVTGRVLDLEGAPIAGANVEVWQADDDGLYDVQYDDLAELRGRARLRTDDRGSFAFWSVRPQPYPIPDDGPVGRLLDATGRSPMRPAHIHFMVSHPAHQTLVTHVFAADDPHLDGDAVFGVRESLITPFERHEPGTAPDGTVRRQPYWTAAYDLVLAPLGSGNTPR